METLFKYEYRFDCRVPVLRGDWFFMSPQCIYSEALGVI